MPDPTAMLGGKIRSLRRRAGLTQAQLARELGISPSYLNLIENQRRPVTAALLIKVAQRFELDLRQLSSDEDSRRVAELMEVFGDPLFEEYGLTNADIREVAQACPGVGRAVVALYRAYRNTRESASSLANFLSDGDEMSALHRVQLPSEEVSDVLQRHLNYFPELESAAAELWQEARLDPTDPASGLARELRRSHGIEVHVRRRDAMRGAMRRLDEEARVLQLSEVLRSESRVFQLAHVLGLRSYGEVLDRVVGDQVLVADESRALCRVALANYFAAAVLMPYERFRQACQDERYDIQLLAHRFGASFEQVCHRLTTLQRPGHRGVPFHLVRIDIAGNISKRFTASGIRFSRFSASCPLWNVHAAFHTPGRIRVQLSQMPDGATYFCVARTLARGGGGYHAPFALQAVAVGCEVEHARRVVYSDGVDLERLDNAVPVGVTCRLCERHHCEQRSMPALHHPLRVDEAVRGVSFYAPVE